MLRDPNIIGQKFKTNSGHIATIIDGENKRNLIIKFEDGVIKKNISYGDLKRGKIAHPSKLRKTDKRTESFKKHIGEIFTTNSGETITIIGGTNKTNIIIQFEDGTIKNNVNYCTIKNGNIAQSFKLYKHKKHIGEIFTTNSGDKITIIDDKDATHITVQFEDGAIRKNVRYDSIKKGQVKHPSKLSKSIKEHIGETFTLKSGYKTTIIDGKNTHDLIIQFEDGTIKNNVNYGSLENGTVAHPYLTKQNKQFHSIKLNYKYLIQHKYAYYDCTCEICNKNMLLTPVGLMQHHLTCQKET